MSKEININRGTLLKIKEFCKEKNLSSVTLSNVDCLLDYLEECGIVDSDNHSDIIEYLEERGIIEWKINPGV